MEELITMIPNVGFPIAISIYLLVKFEKSLHEMTRVQQKMLLVIEGLVHSCRDKKGA